MTGQTFILTGRDTIQINEEVIANFADGNVGEITFSNQLVDTKVGKNGNAIFSKNETGRVADVTLRILAGSPDDKRLNSLKVGMSNDFTGFTLLTGEIKKTLGDGQGNEISKIYALKGGVFSQEVDTTSNTEGDTEQASSIYRFQFANAQIQIT